MARESLTAVPYPAAHATFDEDFHKLTKHRPFRWQRRLFQRLCNGDPPQAIDIPTGLGKTSAMALWLIALARGAALPRRLVYVVDRRAVVDQATRFAEQLRSNMPDSLTQDMGIGTQANGLPISTLRGGFADNRDWLEDPSQPAIVVGTIDMVGSRLLFEGYGVSRRMRPYHAGLLGADALVMLDESHLCPPFEDLLRQVEKHRDGKFGPMPRAGGAATPPFRLMSLSATGREHTEMPSGSIFRLDDRDSDEWLVHQRLTARKRLHVNNVEVPNKLPERLAQRAMMLGSGERPARVLVYCHSRRDAGKVKARIDRGFKPTRKSGLRHQSEMLVGERRIYERKNLEMWLKKHGFLGGADAPPRLPIILVATSAGEVGVDLNADHMVCDLVAWERMVQRLGRVNRRGGKNRSAAVDVFAVHPPKAKANARRAAREKAKREAAIFQARLAPFNQLPCGQDERRDASPAALGDLGDRCPDLVATATTPPPLHPELTRALLDAWSMTSLKRHEGRPQVDPWLRGWEKDEAPQTSVVWRKHLPCKHSGSDPHVHVDPNMVQAYFEAAPIHLTERLDAKSTSVRDWLLKRSKRISSRSEDEERAVQEADPVAILLNRAGEYVDHATLGDLARLGAPINSLSGEKGKRKKEWADRLLPGATLIVDARICGLRDGMMDDKCESEAAAADADEKWRSEVVDREAEIERPMIPFRVEGVEADEEAEGLSTPHLDGWRHVQTFETRFGVGGTVLGGLAVFRSQHDVVKDSIGSAAAVPESLRDHMQAVEAEARRLTSRLNLPDDDAKAVVDAARLHDDGKAADRWQDAANTPKEGRPYAKPPVTVNWRLLQGYRHEFGSLLRAESAHLPEEVRDLVLHLIAAHHGKARPVLSSSGVEEDPPSLLESREREVALRFARLQERYGPWGLAWREAILRAADQRASRAAGRQERRSWLNQ